ncbi:adhesion G protein-coupled receptor E5-like [Agelaius tricolor]|uniref:adhesion G protein-coupled receptor E5-like n=1 Tax=Agelaius tricolor TaxID=9191 RepID=UPI0039F1901B
MGFAGNFGFFWFVLGALGPSPPAEGQGLCQRPLNGTHCGCPKGFEGTPWERSQTWEQRCEGRGPRPAPPPRAATTPRGGSGVSATAATGPGPPPNNGTPPKTAPGPPKTAPGPQKNGTGTPKNGTGTPENGVETPENGTGTPENGTGTPENGTGTPENGIGTPENGIGTPENGPIYCEDVDECAEVGEGLCGGGSVCLNTPGGFECHCPPPGRGPPGPDGCPAVPVPPEICPEEEEGCDLGETLARIAEELRGGRDPRSLLQELLSVLGGALGGSLAAAPPPQRLRRLSALLEAGEGLARGAGTRLPQGGVTNVTMESAALSLAVSRGAPPGPVTLGVPGVTLEVPPEVALDEESGLSLVGLLTLAGLPGALSGAPPVLWGGWARALPRPPRRGRPFPAFRVLSPVGAAFVARASPRPPRDGPAATLRFRHPAPVSAGRKQPRDGTGGNAQKMGGNEKYWGGMRNIGGERPPNWGGTIVCAFWNPRAGRWDTGGCRGGAPQKRDPPPTGSPPGTVCACDHLTSFAVLLAFNEIQVPQNP